MNGQGTPSQQPDRRRSIRCSRLSAPRRLVVAAVALCHVCCHPLVIGSYLKHRYTSFRGHPVCRRSGVFGQSKPLCRGRRKCHRLLPGAAGVGQPRTAARRNSDCPPAFFPENTVDRPRPAQPAPRRPAARHTDPRHHRPYAHRRPRAVRRRSFHSCCSRCFSSASVPPVIRAFAAVSPCCRPRPCPPSIIRLAHLMWNRGKRGERRASRHVVRNPDCLKNRTIEGGGANDCYTFCV